MNTRHPAGFAIVGVLIFIGLIATLGATYMKHVMVHSRTSPSTRLATDRREVVNSGLQYARQAMATGQPVDGSVVDNGTQAATVVVADLGGDRSSLLSTAVDSDGMGTTVLAEAARVPQPVAADPDTLPRPDQTLLAAVMSDASIPKTYITGMQTLSGTEIEGLLIVDDNSALLLDDVIVRGCVISESVLTAGSLGDYDAGTAPVLALSGSARIESGDFLPGLAVCLPDGVLTHYSAADDTRLQVDGDVVSHTVNLDGTGAIHGNVVAVGGAALGGLEQPGRARGPEDWSSALDMGDTWATEFLAFPPRESTVDDLSAITDYSFGSDETGGGKATGGGSKP